MRINWFSPLPPAKTDIAHYTARILPELSRKSEVVLWTDQESWDPSLESLAEVRRYNLRDVPWAEVNRGDLNFYNIGNNRLFHGSIWRVSQQAPGLVVLHDSCLQHFFAGLFLDHERSPERYVSAMEECYGQEGRDAAEDFLDGIISVDEIAHHYPLTPLAVRNALGTVTHVESYAGAGAFCYHPLPYSSNVAEESFRRPPKPPYRLIVFGYIGSNRRLSSTLEALASFGQRELFRLDIFGAIDDEKYYREKIAELHLENVVKIHGFVAEESLEEALNHSDLAINLRYPTMGEASGSQLRIWDHALPSIATRVGWYASLPEAAVLFVDPEHEIRDLHRHFQSFIEDPARFVETGNRGREILVNEHAPVSYVEHLLRFSQNAALMRTAQTATELVGRISGEIRQIGGEGIAAGLVDRAADEIFNMLRLD